jgi:outer membrane protein assembly factor BamB
VVYVGTCDGELLSIEARSGKLKRRFRSDRRDNPHTMPADLSPMVAADWLYYGGHAWGRYLGVEHATWKVRWSRTASTPWAPVLSGDHILLRSGGTILALERRSGRVAWRSDIITHEIAVRGREIFLCNDTGVIVLDASTGVRTRAYRVPCTGQVVAAGETVLTHTHTELIAIEKDSGKLRWRLPLRNPTGLIAHAGDLGNGESVANHRHRSAPRHAAAWVRAWSVGTAVARRVASQIRSTGPSASSWEVTPYHSSRAPTA